MLSFNWKIITGDENDNYSTGILAEHHGADLILMQELDTKGQGPIRPNLGLTPYLHKVVSLICNPTITYPFVISKHTGMTFTQVADEVLYTGLIEMQELDEIQD